MPKPKNTALIVIDVQNDFCAGGALAVAEGDAVIQPINVLLDRFSVRVLTQDWHPADHSSFADNHVDAAEFSTIQMPYGEQILWPRHCVQGTDGASFHGDLAVDRADLIVRKGFRPAIDSYSAFFENDRTTATGLAGYLKDRGVTSLVLAGLATDFCVSFSAIDAVALGFETTLVTDACRAIDLEGSLAAAMETMTDSGVEFATADQV